MDSKMDHVIVNINDHEPEITTPSEDLPKRFMIETLKSFFRSFRKVKTLFEEDPLI